MKNLLLLFLLVLASNVHATLSVVGEVTILETWEGITGPLIAMTDMSATDGQCVKNNLYILDTNHPFFEENFSILLSARISGSSVKLYFDPGVCIGQFLRISHIKL